jgi:hypothetical protein
MNSLENIRKASPEDIIRGKQALGEKRFEEKSSAVPTIQGIWNKPPLGILKLNVDGAYITQTGAGGAGMILRDSKGLIIFSACRSLVFCSSALEAELQACLEGLKFALNLSHDKILVETDSLELVQMTTCKDRDGSCVGQLVRDFRLFLAQRLLFPLARFIGKKMTQVIN